MYVSLIFFAPYWHDYRNASKQKQSNTHTAELQYIICTWSHSNNNHGKRCSVNEFHHLCCFVSFSISPTVSCKRSSRSVKGPTTPPHLLTGVRIKSSKEWPKVFWQLKLSRLLEDKKVAFKIIKARFLFSCGPNIIKKKITNSLNIKQELCSSECPCFSKQRGFPLLRNSSWGFRFPIPCSWDLQSHAAEARLVLYIRTYNRSPPLQTQDYQLQLRLYLGRSTRFYKEL